jgi:hypothetical protein
MRYAIVVLASLLVGCHSKPNESAKALEDNQPTPVAAVRGSNEPAVSNAFTNYVQGEVSAMNNAKAMADSAQRKINRDQSRADSAGQ